MGMQTAWEFELMSKEKLLVTYLDNSPLMREMRKGPIKYVKHQEYGVRKQKDRIRRFSNNRKVNQRFEDGYNA